MHYKCLDGFRKHFCGYVRAGEYFNQTETVDPNSHADHVDHVEGLDVMPLNLNSIYLIIASKLLMCLLYKA